MHRIVTQARTRIYGGANKCDKVFPRPNSFYRENDVIHTTQLEK